MPRSESLKPDPGLTKTLNIDRGTLWVRGTHRPEPAALSLQFRKTYFFESNTIFGSQCNRAASLPKPVSLQRRTSAL